jgi:hypothetical protein
MANRPMLSDAEIFIADGAAPRRDEMLRTIVEIVIIVIVVLVAIRMFMKRGS